jgi:tetratricopeptide (TPR) repeat protein
VETKSNKIQGFFMNASKLSLDVLLEKIARLREEMQFQNAIAICNDIIVSDVACYPAYGARSRIFYDLGRYEDAFKDLEKLIELRPNSPSAYLERAAWGLERGNYKSAIDDSTHVIESGELYYMSMAYFYQCIGYLLQGDKKQATEACSKLPNDFKAYLKTPHVIDGIVTRDSLYEMIRK